MISKNTMKKIITKVFKEKGYTPIKIHDDEMLNFSVGMNVYIYWFNDPAGSTHVIECNDILSETEKVTILNHINYERESKI